MKRLSTAIIIILTGIQVLSGQTPQEKAELFRNNVLPQYDLYFISADLTPGGELILSSRESYSKLSGSGRQAIMDNLVSNWKESLILTQYETQKELWGVNPENGEAILIEAWDINASTTATPGENKPSGSAAHPWFLYVGSAQQMDSFKNVNGSLNLRVGFFLLRNRWDLALTASELLYGNLESESVTMLTTAGLASKVYFPIPKKKMSPYVGIEGSLNLPKGGEISFGPYVLVGASRYLGKGSFDLGLRIGSGTSLMIGYTFIPQLGL